MKILSVAVPCYNSADYMENCINSLLAGGDRIEIIIVNDGSTKDNTAEIADKLAASHPTIIKAVHQENGGHGEAVNTGLNNSTAPYFKVVDSDDWVDEDSLIKILDTLETFINQGNEVDMLISNFVYEKEGALHKKVISYKSAFPQNKVFNWDDIRFLRKDQFILMHSVIYRVEVLKQSGLKLPKHTFYVDNIFVYHPLPYVKNLYYLNVDFYRYFIGREDQSVNEQVMIKRIDQQLKVNYIMIDDYTLSDCDLIKSKKLKKYMKNYLELIMTVSSILIIRSGSKENLDKKEALWDYLSNSDPKTYKKIKNGFLGRIMNLPGRSGRKISEISYYVANKIIGFN